MVLSSTRGDSLLPAAASFNYDGLTGEEVTLLRRTMASTSCLLSLKANLLEQF